MTKKNEHSAIAPSEGLVNEMVAEYEALRKKEKQIAERKKVLADAIKSYALANGVKDDNGSFYSENPNFTFGAQCKKSVKFDEDKASKFFQSKGFDECIKLVPTIDESAVDKRFSDGDITIEELEKITTTKSTYAVVVKPKEELVEVQQATAIAASKKKPVLKRK